MSQALEEREARRSIRAAVVRYGAKLQAASPAAIIATLVAAACMPVVWPLLGGASESAKAAVALAGGTGGAYISDALKRVIERLRREGGSPASKAEAQEALEQELLAHLQAGDEAAAGLRSDVSALLEQVRAIETAVEAAPVELQRSLAHAFSEMGNSFGEFRWMLGEMRDVLSTMGKDLRDITREQRRLSRQQRTQISMTEEIVDRLRYQQSRPSGSPESQENRTTWQTVLPVGVPSFGTTTAPLSVCWQGGTEVAIGDRVYLLHDELLEERFSRDHLLVRRQARGTTLIPVPKPGHGYIWARQVEARREDAPTARKAFKAVKRERELLATLGPGRGFPRVETFVAERGAATLVVEWPASRHKGTMCETLDATRGRNGDPIDPWRLFRLCDGLAGLCTMLTRLHELGCAHRFLSPAAIIAFDGGDLGLRDLGLAARDAEPGEGPADYQAPEQLGGGSRRPGPQTDVYQLAAVAYHLISGHPPNARMPLPIRSAAPVVPQRLSEALDAALSRDPAQRPDIRQFGRTLRATRSEIT